MMRPLPGRVNRCLLAEQKGPSQDPAMPPPTGSTLATSNKDRPLSAGSGKRMKGSHRAVVSVAGSIACR
jgi:hypothetical protein